MVRVIEYQLEGIEGAEPGYRLITTLLDYEQAPAVELAALYHDRWEIETTFDELKTHLRGSLLSCGERHRNWSGRSSMAC